jgi:phage gp46-like protein
MVFLCCAFPLCAQTLDYKPLEWGSVAAEDLQMTVYTPDTTATALVLGDEGYMDVGKDNSGQYEWLLRRHKRIKILSEAALDKYTDVAIFYAHKDGSDHVRQLSAHSIAPDGTVTEVKKGDIFHEKINEYWSKATFAFPEVKVGSILEYRYEHFSHRVLSPNQWTFRGPLPVRSSYFQFGCSVPITYTYLLLGAEYMTAEKNALGEDIIHLGDTRIYINSTRFWMQNGEAVKEEPFMTSLDDYYINIRFQASATTSTITGLSTPVYGTWESTNQELLDDADIGQNYRKNKRHKNLLQAAESAINKDVSQEELLYAINRFITKEIPWSGKYGMRAIQSPDEAFAKHEGSIAEIQYAALALLRAYGIKAYPVLLSTRGNGSMIPSFPFLNQFNYVIAIVEVDDVAKLVDFSDPLLRPGVIREEALNGMGFMVHEDTPAWITLGLPVVQDIFAWNGEITAEGTLIGEMKATMNTLSAKVDRQRMQTQSLEEIWTKRLPNGGSWNELNSPNKEDIREDLSIQGKFEVPEAGFANEDFLYVSPFIHSNFSENPFQREERNYPVNFPYSFEEKSVYQYQMPAGYAVESLPENINVILPNNDASFQYLIREKNQKINIIATLKVTKNIYPPEEYEALRELFASAVQKMQEQIVLKKTE